MTGDISIRYIRESDLAAFKALRLEALRAHPEAFGTDYDEDASQPESVWTERIHKAVDDLTGCIVSADAGSELAGMVGVSRSHGVKNRHAGNIWGVYVRPHYRGKNLTDQMIDAAIGWCRLKGLRLVRLSVVTSNEPAIRCYRRCGFQEYGTSPQEIKIGDVYYEELLMWRRV